MVYPFSRSALPRSRASTMNQRNVASCGELRKTELAVMRSTCTRTAAAFGWFNGIGADVIGSYSAAHSPRAPARVAPIFPPWPQAIVPEPEFTGALRFFHQCVTKTRGAFTRSRHASRAALDGGVAIAHVWRLD